METNTCHLCEKKFFAEALFLKHLRDDEKLFPCLKCGKYFLCQNNLNTHMMHHDRKKTFKCNSCEKRFYQLRDQKRHEVVHYEEMPFSCVECKKQFKREQSLILHLKVHSGERPYKCDLCDKAFIRRDHLKSHKISHIDKKDRQNVRKNRSIKCLEKLSCNICNNMFLKSSLEKHKKTHLKAKPFLCTICNKRFSHKGSLKDHLRIHTGEKPYLCLLCGESFHDTSSLGVHKRTHTEARASFICDICDKSFLRSSHMRSDRGVDISHCTFGQIFGPIMCSCMNELMLCLTKDSRLCLSFVLL